MASSPSGSARRAAWSEEEQGPFYCPVDKKVYLDTAFFQDLERRFRGCDAGSRGCQFSQAGAFNIGPAEFDRDFAALDVGPVGVSPLGLAGVVEQA